MSNSIERAYERGLELIEEGDYFRAHEALEEAWREAEASERDFFQGLVHTAVAWHHARVTGRPVACKRQLEKASRRLRPYLPVHRALDVAALLDEIERATRMVPALPTLRLLRARRDG